LPITEPIPAYKNPVYFFNFLLPIFIVAQLINTQFGFISVGLLYILQFASYAVALFCLRKIINDFHFENKYFQIIFWIFIIYQLIMLVRGFPGTYSDVKYYLQADFIFWPSVIPFFVFFNKKDLTFFYFIKSFYILSLFFLFVSIINPYLITHRSTAEAYILSFAFTAGFLFLNARYVSKKVTWVAVLSLLIGIISFTYLARRNAIASFAGLLLFGLYFIFRNLSASKFIRLIPLFVGIIIIFLLGTDKLPNSFFIKINERLTEDTRSDVFYNYFRGMEKDMNFGKGMGGTYYSPIEEMETDDGVIYGAVENRDVIENGYLQLLLNGGYLQIILFVLTLLPAAILGIFKSTNQLSRACGVVIVLWLIDMSVYGMPRLVLQYILVWMAVGICYANSFRNKTDDEIYEQFEAVGLT
jgi:uncharacterized membrane protein